MFRHAKRKANLLPRRLLFFSHQSAAVRQSDPEEMHVQASEEDSNFSQTKEAVDIIHLQHPFVYDQLDLRALAMEGILKSLKHATVRV